MSVIHRAGSTGSCEPFAMELELLLAREPWSEALNLLQAWRGLELLDPGLQSDGRILRRLVTHNASVCLC